jgi:hypothetical protein
MFYNSCLNKTLITAGRTRVRHIRQHNSLHQREGREAHLCYTIHNSPVSKGMSTH